MSVRSRVAAASPALATLSRHGRTFRLAGTLLPREMLRDAAELYAFCRHVDDLADEYSTNPLGRDGACAALAELRRAVQGSAPMPVLAGFRRLVVRHALDPAIAARLIDTMIGDLGPVRIADEAALLRYAYGAAGTVGLMMCRLLGVTAPRASPHALDLGVAMQLTNIARDVAEDAKRDRIYLPQSWLAGAQPTQPQPVFTAVERVLALADLYYESGRRGLAYLPWRPRLAIGAAAAVYREIGRRILRAGPDYLLAPRCVVPQRRRLTVLAGSLPRSLLSRRPGRHCAALHELLRGERGAQANEAAGRSAAD